MDTSAMNSNSSLWMESSSVIIMPEVVMTSFNVDNIVKHKSDEFAASAPASKFPRTPELVYESEKFLTSPKPFEFSVAESSEKSEGTVMCTWCKVEFNNKNILLDHIEQNHRVDRVHRCSECSKVFSQKSNLKAHYRLHTGEKPFKCDYCSKMFAQKSNLMNHLSVHTRDKPFACPICRRAFSQRSNLKSHIFTHTGEKPYKCHLCMKEFVQKSNLVSHVRTHTSEKPHHCDICLKNFSQRSNLSSHMKIHAKTNSFIE